MSEDDDVTLDGGTHQPTSRPEITHKDLPTEIGHYAIEGLIGAGGMGRVYRGKDTRLDRSVAIKVLPASFVHDGSSLERFTREAKVLASLNHPNIATIHGIEKSGSINALVLELVEGETLAERLQRGPMSMTEAMPIFRQIAEALEAAHQRGIVHRDLKPANIKFTRDGLVKVLDFGLAKAVNTGPSGTQVGGSAKAETPRPDFTTQSGMILGTAAYMSPEQSRGLEVDQRTDVWAFGCCLYECLTGRRPFQGKTISDVLAEILKSDPDFTLVPPETPNELVSLLRRCLEKEPRRRWRDIGDLAIRLEEIVAPKTSTGQRVDPAMEDHRTHWWQNAYAIMLLAFLMVVLGYNLGGPRTTNPPGEVKGTVPEKRDAINALAVLPFENSKPNDATNDWVSTTMRDEIRVRLGALSGLTVKTGYRLLKESGSPAREVASNMGVDALITGSYLMHLGQLQVRVFLIDAATGAETVLGTHEAEETEILELQKQAAMTIANRIRADISSRERAEIVQDEDVDPEAYIAFREGLTQLDAYTSGGFAGAIRSFEKAIKLDPSFITPRVKLAYTHWLPMIWGTKLGTAREGFQRADAVLAEARIAFPDERSIPVAQSYFNMLSKFDWKGAKQAFDAELSTPGFDPEVYVMRCWYLLFVEGRYHEALRSIDRALMIDPDRLGYQDARAEVFSFMDNEAEALRLNRAIQDRQPDGFDWLCNIAWNLKNLKRLPEALAAAEEAVQVSDRNPSTLAVLAEIHAAMGETEKMQTLLDELSAQEQSGVFVPSTWVARVHLTNGDLDRAVSMLTTAFEQQEGNSFLYNLRKMDVVRALAGHQGYWDLIERMKYPRFPIDHPFHEKEKMMRSGHRDALSK